MTRESHSSNHHPEVFSNPLSCRGRPGWDPHRSVGVVAPWARETSSDNFASQHCNQGYSVGGSVTAGPGMAPLSALTLTESRNTSSNHGYIQGSGRVETVR